MDFLNTATNVYEAAVQVSIPLQHATGTEERTGCVRPRACASPASPTPQHRHSLPAQRHRRHCRCFASPALSTNRTVCARPHAQRLSSCHTQVLRLSLYSLCFHHSEKEVLQDILFQKNTVALIRAQNGAQSGATTGCMACSTERFSRARTNPSNSWGIVVYGHARLS